ncbi:MAG: sensor histidine kinase [Chloroflexi bacterium]|nr:sensor histidine kinase [Chloroflexota bacterium]
MGSPISVLVAAASHLCSGTPDWPEAWNQAFQVLAGSDPFFGQATLNLCRLDLEKGAREMLASWGPRAHDLTQKDLTLAGIEASTTDLLSLAYDGGGLILPDNWRLPAAVADLLRRLLPSPSTKSIIFLPLLSNGRLIGVFWIEGYDPAGHTEDRIPMLRLLGHCLSLSLAASEHQREIEERDLALRAALEAQEKETQRIALDVHDGALQTLASAFQHLQAVRDRQRQDEEARGILVKASGLLREAMHELRGLMESLRPATLDQFGLISAIESDVRELRQGGWQIDQVADPILLPRDVETALYRVVHEALTNIRRHAGTCLVRVSLETRDDWLRGEIRDWGRGFAPADQASKGSLSGFGLLSMRKRIELLGGRLEMESRPGTGTRVAFQVPLPREGV